MEHLSYIFEPERLYLAWHSPAGDGKRFVVGELFRDQTENYFRYLPAHPDFDEAKRVGFFNYPAFEVDKAGGDSLYKDAVEVFMKRLPPRKRSDFKDYLRQYNLPADFGGSDFALLAYTGAKLASDTFELYPDLSNAQAPIDFVVDVAGVRHYATNMDGIEEGDPLTIEPETENKHDANALRIVHKMRHIGYVGRVYAAGVKSLMDSGDLSASVLKVTASHEKIRILALLKYRKPD